MSRYGASTFSSLFDKCVLWAPLQHSAGVSGDIDEFPILPSGVTVTNNGTFTKTALGNNKSVLNFDGSTNYISLTDNDAWDLFGNDFTIGFWFKTNTSGSHHIVSQYLDSSNGWLLDYYTTSSRLYISGEISNVSQFNYNISHTHMNDEWNYFVITKSGTTPGTWTIYKNGVSQSVNIIIAYTGATFSLNAVLNSMFRNGIFCAGNLAHLMIWKGRALTQPEIKLLMNRTNPDPTNGYGAGAGLMPANGKYWRLT